MKSEFVLIDLVSQREAVRKLLGDRDADAKLNWIAAHGTIRKIEHSGKRPTYVFKSPIGFKAGFFFDDAGDFVFIGDHHTFK